MMLNKMMIQKLLNTGMIRNPKVVRVMESVDRKNFVLPDCHDAYADMPQYIGFGQTISAPHMHATALELLLPELETPNARVLDVGSGSGYLSTLFARSNPSATIIGIDIVEELVSFSIQNVMKSDADLFESGRLKLMVGNGWKGLDEYGPFDCIHVGAAASKIPNHLIKILKIGGKILIPIGPEGQIQELFQIERAGERLEDVRVQKLMHVAYVPLVNE